MGIKLGIRLKWAGFAPYYSVVANAFKARVEADGGTVESMSCLKADLKELNPIKPPSFTGLLNDYSGAAAAYSLRLLDNTYTGDAIVVRRASDNTTQAIGFVNNELDTASLETFCSGTDGFVTTWYDQSGNGNDATQSTASSQPQIVSSGSTILENGKAAIQWDGSSSNMNATGFGTGQQRSVFTTMIGNGDGNGYENYFIFSESGGTGDFMQIYSTSYTSSLNANFPTAGLDITSSTAPNTQQIISLLKTTSNSYLYQNTSLSGSGSGAQSLEDYLNLGNFTSNYAFVKYQEFIVYNSDESTNRTGIETNINDFYSIY